MKAYRVGSCRLKNPPPRCNIIEKESDLSGAEKYPGIPSGQPENEYDSDPLPKIPDTAQLVLQVTFANSSVAKDPIEISGKQLNRVQEIFQKKGLRLGLVFVGASLVVATCVYLINKSKAKGRQREQIPPKISPLTPEQKLEFEKLYEDNLPTLNQYVSYRIFGLPMDAEDVQQKIALKAYGAFDRFAAGENKTVSFKAWIFEIAHNLIVNYYRDSSGESANLVELNNPDEENTNDPIELLVDPLLSEIYSVESITTEPTLIQLKLRSLLTELIPRRKQLLMYKYIFGFSNAEIAYIMDVNESAVKSIYHRILISLKKDIESTSEV